MVDVVDDSVTVDNVSVRIGTPAMLVSTETTTVLPDLRGEGSACCQYVSWKAGRGWGSGGQVERSLAVPSATGTTGTSGGSTPLEAVTQ